MMHRPRALALALALCLFALVSASAGAQRQITTPREEFGANFGDDYFLASYRQIAAYWRKLERESDRIRVVEIGKTAEGRPHLMAIVTSPENHRNLARYREISSRLAHAEGLTDSTARALAKEGKAVVWIDGGLHATEVLGAQQLGEMVYQMVSRTDEETLRFLNDCILLLVHANPDGNDLVADWYMRNPVPEQRTTSGLPRLYQKYIGHTTTGSSSPRRRPRRRTSTGCSTMSGSRSSSTTTIRADRRGRSCTHRPFAIRTTTISTR